ncbi:WhiB family transcriptional regulator [Rhodococcus sp. NBC_00294]|uniref:WhiB family transcriptional regulator n=1 Tax=Rhodococcus sp. NBC_00294 TaxID=2976004 RepID=UPI003FA79FC7
MRVDDSDADNWRQHAACSGADPAIFFPSNDAVDAECLPAKKFCSVCSVRAQCLEFAVAQRETFGIWGGMHPRQRRAFSRSRTSTDRSQRRREQWRARTD